jgi:hypothetical protein
MDKSVYFSYFDGNVGGERFHVENDYPYLPVCNDWLRKRVSNDDRDTVYTLTTEISLGSVSILIDVDAIVGVRYFLPAFNRVPGQPYTEERILLTKHRKDANGLINYSMGYFEPKADDPFRVEVLWKDWIPGRGVAMTVRLKGTLYCYPEQSISIDAIYGAKSFRLDY